jgi:hypothetical protein
MQIHIIGDKMYIYINKSHIQIENISILGQEKKKINSH